MWFHLKDMWKAGGDEVLAFAFVLALVAIALVGLAASIAQRLFS